MAGVASLVFKGALVAALAAVLGVAQGQQPVLKVSAIPDEAPTELQRKFAPLGKYLLCITMAVTPSAPLILTFSKLMPLPGPIAW